MAGMNMARLGLLAVLSLGALLGGCGRSTFAIRESGDRNMADKNYDAAIEDYKEYIDRAPGNAFVYQSLGKAYLAKGQTGMARENLLLASSLRMEDDDIFANTCEALFADKKFEELNRLLRAKTTDRGRMKDYLLLGKYSDKEGDLDEAQRAYKTAAQVDRGISYQPHLELAKLYARIGDKGRAMERLRMAYWADPNQGEVLTLAKEWGQITGPTFAMVPPEISEMDSTGVK